MKRGKYALLAGAIVIASVVTPAIDTEAKASGEWKQDSKGWWFQTEQGRGNGYAKSEWVNGYWLDAQGYWTYKAIGKWKKDSKGWYFIDTNKWYPKNQWQTIDYKTFYFNSDGYMAKSEFIKGRFVNKNGVATTTKDGKWKKGKGANAGKLCYTYNKTKVLKNGWYRIDGRDYYFDAKGWLVSWKVAKIGKQIYAFDAKGHQKKYTKITMGKTVNATLTFTLTKKNKAKAAADMNSLLGTITKSGTKKVISIDGKAVTIQNKKGTIYVGKQTLVKYIKSKAAGTIVVKGKGKVSKLFDVLKFKALGSKYKTYNYSIKIGKVKFTSFGVKSDYVSFVVDGKKYQGLYLNEKLFMLGDVSKAQFVKTLKAKGAFGTTKVLKNTKKK